MIRKDNGPEELEPIEIPIQDVLDLHAFQPQEVPGLLEEYFCACRQADIYSVRIIHGKGQGFLRNRVRGLLAKSSVVSSFSEGPASAGGWGATLVELRRGVGSEPAEGKVFVNRLNRGARAMGVHLDRAQLDLFALHAKELLEWNEFAGLTATVEPTEMAEKLFLDVLPVLAYVPTGARVLDIGSGGGFPGLPLKVIRPDLDMTLIDGKRKKINFVKHVARAMGLAGIKVQHARAEDVAGDILRSRTAGYDVVISKAVATLDKLVRLSVPLLHEAGMIIAMKGASVGDEVENARRFIESGRMQAEKKEYRLPLLGTERSLVILSKVCVW